jgi:hypothetical protein
MPANGRWRKNLAWPLALAAGVLLAFLGGRFMGGSSNEERLAAVSDAGSANIVSQGSAGTQHPGMAAITQQPNGPAEPAAGGVWETVRLNLKNNETGESEQLELPVRDISLLDANRQIDGDWLERSESAFPEQLVESLRQTGHQVRTERQWWPLEMSDGRHVVVPVEQFEVRFVGSDVY